MRIPSTLALIVATASACSLCACTAGIDSPGRSSVLETPRTGPPVRVYAEEVPPPRSTGPSHPPTASPTTPASEPTGVARGIAEEHVAMGDGPTGTHRLETSPSERSSTPHLDAWSPDGGMGLDSSSGPLALLVEGKPVIEGESWYEAELRYQPTSPMILTASAVADCDRRSEYLSFIQRHPYEVGQVGLDLSRRLRFRIVDRYDRPVNNATVTVSGPAQGVRGRTHADGVWDLYPSVHWGGWSGTAGVSIQAGQGRMEAGQVYLGLGDGQEILIHLAEDTCEPPDMLDLGFLIDVTGSMSDELRYVNQEVAEIVRRIEMVTPGLEVRVGATFYRDRGDEFVVRQIAFTEDVEGFAQTMYRVDASGGGDYPEDMNAGLQAALTSMDWSGGNAVRVLVHIADAPPQDYHTSFDYREAAITASQAGIRILPVAASGADRSVEVLFRALGAITSTPYVYLTDHSGVGNPHLVADTTRMSVEYFNDLLTRMIIADLRGEGMHEPEWQGRPVASAQEQFQAIGRVR